MNEYTITLTKDELEVIQNALQYQQNEHLPTILETVKNMKYGDVKWLYANEEVFKKDMENKKKIINEQIEEIDKISEKIENQMYGED